MGIKSTILILFIILHLTYISRYTPLALSEQAKFGVPYEITIGQALLESGGGTSDIARMNNNHFGMKCHERNCSSGHCTPMLDNLEGRTSRFRKFNTVWESYRAHSVKLSTEERYASLRGLDWRSYAYGLERCGWSADPEYAEKLIRVIETNLK